MQLNMNKSGNAMSFIKERQDRQLNGILTNFKNFGRILPAWDVNTTTILAGKSGDGKSSWVWEHAVVQVIDFIYKNPNVTSHIYFFSLELKYTELYIKVFATLLYKRFNKVYPREIFIGIGEERLSQEEIDYIEVECKPFMTLLDKHVTIIDLDLTPSGILVEAVSRMQNSTDEYKFVIIDTVNAIGIEPGSTKQESMKLWNQEYALKKLRNERNCIVINIMQLDNEASKRAFDRNGQSIYEKYLPSLEAMGNDKEASRSASLVLSLFDPSTFDIKVLNGYNVGAFDKKLRFLYVLKNNFGDKGISFPFVYHGVSNTWLEVTHTPDEFKRDSSLYLQYGINPVASTEENVRKKYTTNLED